MAELGETPSNGKKVIADIVDETGMDDDPFPISADSFEEQFDENILHTLDVTRWRLGSDLGQEYARIEREVREAELIETEREKQIREEVLPQLGLHKTTAENIASVQRGLLFNGGVEACDGAIEIHETLPLTIYQI